MEFSLQLALRLDAHAGLISILGPSTPFLLMWIWNTIDAMILTYAAWERGNKAYLILNIFWMLVGLVGIYTSYFGNAFTH